YVAVTRLDCAAQLIILPLMARKARFRALIRLRIHRLHRAARLARYQRREQEHSGDPPLDIDPSHLLPKYRRSTPKSLVPAARELVPTARKDLIDCTPWLAPVSWRKRLAGTGGPPAGAGVDVLVDFIQIGGIQPARVPGSKSVKQVSSKFYDLAPG